MDDPDLKQFEAVVLVEPYKGWPLGAVGAVCDMLSATHAHLEIFYTDGWTAGLAIVPLSALSRYDCKADGPVARCDDSLLQAHPDAEKRRSEA